MAKEEDIICPNCGSDNVSAPMYSKWMYFIVSLLLFIPLPYYKGTYHCFDCDLDFKEKDLKRKGEEEI